MQTGSPYEDVNVKMDEKVCFLSDGSEYNYSLSFSQQGNYVSARAYYERALQLVPDSKLLQENLAKLDRLEKRLQEVREKDQMQQHLTKFPRDSTGAFGRGRTDRRKPCLHINWSTTDEVFLLLEFRVAHFGTFAGNPALGTCISMKEDKKSKAGARRPEGRKTAATHFTDICLL